VHGNTVQTHGTAVILAAVMCWCGSFSQSVSDTDQSISFRPHRAVYDVSLAHAASGSSVAHLEGRMVYELSGNNCEGYTQNLRFVTRTTNQNGAVNLTDLRTASWESGNSEKLRFEIKNYLDNKLAEETSGTAQRSQSQGTVVVILNKPGSKSLTISPQIMFPIAHSKAVIAAAEKGDTIYQAQFYDGSESGEKVYLTTAAIGKKVVAVTRSQSNNPKDGKLDVADVTSWPVAMSYFDSDNTTGDATPAFEMSYRFHDNGVTSKFLIDHGDFSFKGVLAQLVYTAEAGCRVEHKTQSQP